MCDGTGEALSVALNAEPAVFLLYEFFEFFGDMTKLYLLIVDAILVLRVKPNPLELLLCESVSLSYIYIGHLSHLTGIQAQVSVTLPRIPNFHFFRPRPPSHLCSLRFTYPTNPTDSTTITFHSQVTCTSQVTFGQVSFFSLASAMTQLAAMFANLILIETLHSRLTGQLFELDNFLSLVPSELQEVRLVTLESIHVLRNGLVATLETQRVVEWLTIHRRLALFIHEHGHLPPIEDVDNVDD